jgi:light-regulated signal transduction histidine kinase (bacteriophytochrome)
VEISLSPLKTEEGTLVLSAIRDITERKRFERELQEKNTALEAANRELEAFSYSISHDLRAPLRAMGGFARVLERQFAGQLPPEAQQAVQRIRDNATKMGQLIDGLLEFSRLNSSPIRKTKVSPAGIARAVFEELRPEVVHRSMEMDIAELPDCEADAKLLKQVFANLLSNALKYTRGRDPAVIKIGCQKKNPETVYFIQDNGTGFDMQYAGKLFGVFQRLHSADEFDGTGVGLAIVQRIIHRHGGRVWAEAQLDRGATFYFTLCTPGHA